MVNKKVATPANNKFDSEENSMVEMRVVMDDLTRQIQTLEDNTLHIQ